MKTSQHKLLSGIILILLWSLGILPLLAQETQNVEDGRYQLSYWEGRSNQILSEYLPRISSTLSFLSIEEKRKVIRGFIRRTNRQVLLEMLGETLKTENPLPHFVIQQLGPSLSWCQGSAQNFQNELLATIKDRTLPSLKDFYKIEGREGDIFIANLFQTIFYLYPLEERFIQNLKQELKKTLDWPWTASEARETISSIIATINDHLHEPITRLGKDGKEMVLIPAGKLVLSLNDNIHIDVNAYYVDKTEVTNQEYATFLNLYRQKDPRLLIRLPISRIRKQMGKYRPHSGYENLPVVGVTWYGAQTYADFYGKRVPTREEWQKAFTGELPRLYPWGDDWDPKKTNWNSQGASPVGTYPQDVSPYGIYDMAGNVAEWTSFSCHPENPDNPRLVCGGSWTIQDTPPNVPKLVNTYHLNMWRPTEAFIDVGFRCVEAP